MSKGYLTHFIAVGAGCWGRGTSEKEAIRNMCRYGSEKEPIYLVYRVHKDARVDGMGSIESPIGFPCEKVREVGFK